jgi:hypothetical protein
MAFMNLALDPCFLGFSTNPQRRGWPHLCTRPETPQQFFGEESRENPKKTPEWRLHPLFRGLFVAREQIARPAGCARDPKKTHRFESVLVRDSIRHVRKDTREAARFRSPIESHNLSTGTQQHLAVHCERNPGDRPNPRELKSK